MAAVTSVRPPAPLDIELPDSDEVASARWVNRPRWRDRRNTVIGFVVATLLAAGAAAWFVREGSGRFPGATHARRAESIEPATATLKEVTGDEEGDVPESASPSQGQPLTLRLIPDGARIVIHLRPADLWRADGPGDEFRECLGPLGVWLQDQIAAHCLLPPSKIDEVTLALIPVSRDAFDFSIVVRHVRSVRRSDLIDRFGGNLIAEPQPHYVARDRVLRIHDAQTFAIAPRDMSAPFLASDTTDGATSEGIGALLPETDRDRHFTLIAELQDVRTGLGSLVPANVQPSLSAALDFFGDDVETVAWSVHLGDGQTGRKLYSELLIRNRGTRAPPHLADDLERSFARLPDEVLELVRDNKPAEPGKGKVVGRLPVMVRVAEQSTSFEIGNRMVVMRCELPERAGPNLALGVMLVWNQARTATQSRETERMASSPSPAPASTISQRLQKRISVEFRGEGLADAVKFIGGEIDVEFRLNGPGIKRAGATQNEKQKFVMQDAPAAAILDRMLTSRRLVLIVDDRSNQATITGAEDAAEQGLTPFPLK